MYYRANHVCINQNVHAWQPQDSNLSNLASVALERPEESDQMTLTPASLILRSHLYLLLPGASHSVQQQQSIQPVHTSSTTHMWPSIGGTPINELTTKTTSPAPSPLSSPLVQLRKKMEDGS